MINEAAAFDDGNNADTKLVEISIVLVAGQNDPSVLNPDMLRYKGIVDEALNLSEPPLTMPVYSQVVYERGITIRAEPNRFTFVQAGQPLDEDDCAIPKIAGRFVDQMSHVPYKAVGVNAKLFHPIGGNSSHRLTDCLIDSGGWASFKDVLPEIEFKSIYRYKGRRITLDVGGASEISDGGAAEPGYLHQANVHRDIDANDQRERIRMVLDIVGNWSEDVSDIKGLVKKYQSRILA